MITFLCFRKFLILLMPENSGILTYEKLANMYSNGKCSVTLIPASKPMRLYVFSQTLNTFSHYPLIFNNNDLDNLVSTVIKNT